MEGAAPTRVRLGAADALALLVLCLFLLVELDVARSSSVTCDEVPHIGAGLSYVTSGTTAIEQQHPPLVKLASGAFLAPPGGSSASASP